MGCDCPAISVHKNIFIIFFVSITLLFFYGSRHGLFFINFALIILGCVSIVLYYKTKIIFNYSLFFTILFLSFLTLLSALLHYAALNNLDPAFFITVDKLYAEWGKWTVIDVTSIYILFNLSIICAFYLLAKSDNLRRLLILVPVLFIPSLLIALYQGIVDLSFMNRHAVPMSSIHIMGLSFDQSAFGMLLYLVFPLSLIGIITSNKLLFRIFYSSLSLLIVVCLFMRGQKTTFLGLLFFLFCLSFLHLWVYGWSVRWKYFKKMIISFALCICVVFGFVLYFDKNPEHKPFLWIQIERYIGYYKEDGIKSIPHARDRLWEVGKSLTEKSPIAGWGPGGYYRNLNNELFESEHRLRSVHNAANYYLQVSSELGLIGLLFTLIIYVLPALLLLRARSKLSKEDRWISGILLLSMLIFMFLYITGPHIFAPDVLWVVAIYLGAILFLGKPNNSHKSIDYKKLLCLALPFFFLLTVIFTIETYKKSFGSDGYSSLLESEWWPLKNEYGYYHQENWGGVEMRWLSKSSSTAILATGDIIEFKVSASDINSSGPKGLTLNVAINDTVHDTLHFFNGGEQVLRYYYSGIKGQKVVLRTEVSRTFNQKRMGLSSDGRTLGIARGVINFSNEIPKYGIGFHYLEEQRDHPEPYLSGWTSQRASIPLSEIDIHNLEIFLAHPDIDTDPVDVSIYYDDQVVWEKQVTSNDWIQAGIDPEIINDSGIITFQVSRTWNPKAMGISEDDRDLGLGVRIPR